MKKDSIKKFEVNDPALSESGKFEIILLSGGTVTAGPEGDSQNIPDLPFVRGDDPPLMTGCPERLHDPADSGLPPDFRCPRQCNVRTGEIADTEFPACYISLPCGLQTAGPSVMVLQHPKGTEIETSGCPDSGTRTSFAKL